MGVAGEMGAVSWQAKSPVVLTEADIASMVIPGRSLYPPTTIPRTHGIPAAEIHLRSHHVYPLDLFAHFAGHAASALGIPATRPIPLPTQRSMWTVLRGPFVHKKSQENFERRVHKRVIKAWDADALIVDRWVRYLRTHQLPGVGIRVTTWERAPLGVGKQIFEQAMEKIRPDTEEIKALAEKIVEQEMSVTSEGGESPTEKPLCM
ncbi:ribosomal protein S10 domain-containing protein [Boletus reticuloceps]|uniref:Small ribosomal subunit protein uS10m n=1 Tax=Boletus reticuloceps TaxID=495285 RepID=A0A8I2YK31_9AGAM|nr:ribosomal protein S10 domain-containing protein [Boletus reticuloceps]